MNGSASRNKKSPGTVHSQSSNPVGGLAIA
jgi:hypothetical protein